MTLINTIDKIVIQCKCTTRVYFWHFLDKVSCRISRASSGFAPSTPTPPWICLGAQNASLQIHSCREVIACCASSRTFIPHVIYKQQTQGKIYINFDDKTQGKMDGNHQNFRDNSGKMMLKIPYEPCLGGVGNVSTKSEDRIQYQCLAKTNSRSKTKMTRSLDSVNNSEKSKMK